MTTISVSNLKGGVGKTSLARLLAEKMKGSVLNFDPKRNAELYNSVETLNIGENAVIERLENFLIVDNKKISSKNGILIADFGGQYDKRLASMKSDFYILPTADDFESLSETVRTALMILNKEPDAKIIFVLNKYLIRNKKDEETALNDFKSILIENKLEKYKVLTMPYSKIFKNVVNEGALASNFMKTAFEKFQYRKINDFLENLIGELK